MKKLGTGPYEKYFDHKRLRLVIQKQGFTLWDVKKGRWVVDASILSDGTLAINQKLPVCKTIRNRTYHTLLKEKNCRLHER